MKRTTASIHAKAQSSALLQSALAPRSLNAWLPALAHAKSGDAGMLAGSCGKTDELDEAMATFAHAYADQTERDHAAMAKAAKSGKLAVAKVF